MTLPPVGRRSEWAQLIEVVDLGSPAVVVVAGGVGSGRSHLVRRFGAECEGRGFRVVGTDEVFDIERSSTLADIRRMLAAALGIDTVSTAAAAPDGIVRKAVTDLVRFMSDESAIYRALRDAAPLLFVIDGYDPTPAVSRWLTTFLIPRIRRGDEQVILVITGVPDTVAGLRSQADLSLPLGPLNRDEVAQHLNSLGQTLSPPLSAEEIDGYCNAAVADASVLKWLRIVFTATAGVGGA